MLFGVFVISHLQNFTDDPDRARRWIGLRQDSGDPFTFAPRSKAFYANLGIDYREKMLIFSDSLNLDKALQLKRQCDELGFKCMSQEHLIISSALSYPSVIRDWHFPYE